MKGTLDGLVRGFRPRTFNNEKVVKGEAGVPSDRRSSFDVVLVVAASGFEELPAMCVSVATCSAGVPEWLCLAGSAELHSVSVE